MSAIRPFQVSHAFRLEVRSIEGQQVIVLELCVHPEDVGGCSASVTDRARNR
jgi:predicted RNA-binding protein YlqC (UPF0109 family)